MKNIFRLVIIALNILLYNLVDIENIDIFVSNIIILNLLSSVLFIYFDDYTNQNIEINKVENKRNLKGIIFFEFKKYLKDIFNWLIFLFPLTFYFITKLNHTFSEKELIFFIVMIVFLELNIIALSSIIKRKHKKTYFVYIVITGIIFQLFTMFFSHTFKNIAMFLIGLILLTYISIIVIIYSNTIKTDCIVDNTTH